MVCHHLIFAYAKADFRTSPQQSKSRDGGFPKLTVSHGKSNLEMDDDLGYSHLRKPPYNVVIPSYKLVYKL